VWIYVQEPNNSGIAWIANNSSKPGRPEGAECWVVHASPEWSNARASLKAGDVASELLALFLRCVGMEGKQAVHAKAFKWGNAYPLNPAVPASGEAFYFDKDLGLGACGDWTRGPRVGDAFQSGLEMGQCALKSLGVAS